MSFEDNGLREIRPTDEGVVLDLMHTAKAVAWEAKKRGLMIRISATMDGECQIRVRAPGKRRFIECGTWDGKEYYYLGRFTESGNEVVKEIAAKDISFDALLEETEEGRTWMPWSRRRMI